LSLPIAMTVLYVVASQKQERHFLKHLLLLLPLIILVAVTHHVTGYVLAGFLFLWTIAALIRNQHEHQWLKLAGIALLVLVIIVPWTFFVGNVIFSYLIPVFRNGFDEFFSLISLENSGRQLFQSASGQVSPFWERVIGVASVICILLVLPIGVLQ